MESAFNIWLFVAVLAGLFVFLVAILLVVYRAVTANASTVSVLRNTGDGTPCR